MSMIKFPTIYLSLFMAVTVIMAAAELKRFEHKVKPDGSFNFLVVGDWGRSGLYNQSNVAYQNVEVALEESTARWKIVVGHHTLFSAGVHGTTLELLDKLLPILQEHDVNLYINGHDHCLQHISSPNSQLQFLTSGGGSKAWRGDFNLENLNEMKFFYDGQGFMAAEVRGNDLNLAFYDIFGNILHKWSASDNPHSSL